MLFNFIYKLNSIMIFGYSESIRVPAKNCLFFNDFIISSTTPCITTRLMAYYENCHSLRKIDNSNK